MNTDKNTFFFSANGLAWLFIYFLLMIFQQVMLVLVLLNKCGCIRNLKLNFILDKEIFPACL